MNKENKKCDCGCTTDKYGIGKAVTAIFSGVGQLVIIMFLGLICSDNTQMIPTIFKYISGR